MGKTKKKRRNKHGAPGTSTKVNHFNADKAQSIIDALTYKGEGGSVYVGQLKSRVKLLCA
jgi:hypothetical protein